MARTNRKYGRLNAETGEIEYAPTSLTLGGRLVMNPQAAHYAQAGYLPIDNGSPSDSAAEGYHWEAKGWEVQDGRLKRVFEQVKDEPRPVYVSKAKVEAEIDAMGKTAEFFAWLNSKAAYVGGWMRGGDMVEYDPAANGGDLASLIAALSIPAEAVAGLMAKVVA